MIFSIFESENPEQLSKKPRFAEHDSVQNGLRKVCEAWQKYLENYVKQTTKLFHGTPKLPWEEKERALVSTLSAALARSYRKAVVVSELPVSKKGTHTTTGWCDIWATIPEIRLCDHPFSFYLEAKIFRKPKSVKTLAQHLTGNYGIAKVLRDYASSSGQRFRQKSPFVREKNKRHEHHAIAMLMIPVFATKRDLPKIRKILEGAYTKTRRFQLKDRTITRTMSRYPTVGLITLSNAPKQMPSMIAGFTVFGCTPALTYRDGNQ